MIFLAALVSVLTLDHAGGFLLTALDVDHTIKHPINIELSAKDPSLSCLGGSLRHAGDRLNQDSSRFGTWVTGHGHPMGTPHDKVKGSRLQEEQVTK